MNHFRARLPNNSPLPPRIERLHELAYNLWWTWNPEAERMFRLIDSYLWEEVYHNPIKFLKQVRRTQINFVVNDRFFLDFYDRILRSFDRYLETEGTWFRRTYPTHTNGEMAYFSMEFGLHESLPIYAGGLGVLSGDHLKEASDLGLPMVAVGLLYTEGYFEQRITQDGWQETVDSDLDVATAAVSPVIVEGSDKQLKIAIDLPGRTIAAQVWEVRVGRVPLYLLDTNLEENGPSDRMLTARLYNSDLDVRISQYMLLGIGGARALRAMGYDPQIWHMNEGHAAFLGLELARELVAQGMSFEEARLKLRARNIFTTHTPVPAGNDEFPVWLMDKYFSGYLP
jgi:starch phosphorylase